MNHDRQINALADELRSSGALGKAGALPRLFEYLLAQSREGRTPKELDIALDVFNKDERFDVTTDSVVRVYVHKLRRKLDDHYARLPNQARLIIPKGEYRLVIEAPGAAAESEPMQPAPLLRPSTSLRLVKALLIVSLAINAAFVAHRWIGPVSASPPAHSHPVWSRLLDDDLPIYIVVGDYYIFGEAGDDMNIRRLVREFDINSPADLREHLYRHPDLSPRYQNLDLSYLPTATAFALRELMPVLAASKRNIEIVQASDVTAQILKSGHVLYIGYLSGLRSLRELTLKHSRFAFGESYDELVDHVANRRYVSQAGVPIEGEMVYFDYGYVSSVTAPNGHQIVTVAGLRDAGVMHSAELLADDSKLQELRDVTESEQGFEALYEVSAIDRTNVKGRLIVSAPLAGTMAARATAQ